MAITICYKCRRKIDRRQGYSTGMCEGCNNNPEETKMIRRGKGNIQAQRYRAHQRQGNSHTRTTNDDRIVVEEKSFIGTLTGRDNAIFLKNRYQQELENTWIAIVKFVHYLGDNNSALKRAYSKIPKLKKDIEAHEEERAKSYANLGNVLTKETDFEEKMWKTTVKSRTAKSITVKQKFKDSDIDEMKFDSMNDYLEKYPEYRSKSSFKRVLDKIEKIETEIRDAQKKYNYSVENYNSQLLEFEITIQKAEDKFVAYDKIKAEAERKLSDARYNNGFLNKYRSEQSKAEAQLDLMSHRPEQFKNTLEIIKSEHSGNQRKKFKEIEY